LTGWGLARASISTLVHDYSQQSTVSKVTDRTTFLGFEGWQIKVTAAVLGIIPTATLLLIGWDDMDALWMVVRTRRFKRRQRYRDLIRDSQTQPSVDDPPALPPSEDKEVDTSV